MKGSIIRDYEYDLLGNFDKVTKGSSEWDYSYAAGNPSRLMSVTNLAMTVNATQGYDSRGNLWKYTKSGIAYELTFDVENRLQSVKVGTGTPTTFEYDADGQRVLTTIGTGASQVKIYTPFPDYEKEIPTSGSTTIRTTYRIAGQIVAVQTKIGAAAGTFYFTYTDHLGNVAALSWTGGTLVPGSLASYDPFGTLTTTPSTNPSITNHGFTGHRHNNTGTNDLGLIYMNARYYLPQIGRFVSPDSIVPDPGNPQSYNRYSYVRNSPMNLTDPTGHRECENPVAGGCADGQSNGGESAEPIQAATPSPAPSNPPPSLLVTTPRVPEAFPLPASSDLTQWLIDLLVAYANSDQINRMATTWFLGKLFAYTGQGEMGALLMGDVLQEWARHVWTDAVWDFKPDLRDFEHLLGEDVILGCTTVNLQAVANIFYGFIGRQIGMGEILLQAGAGAAQFRNAERWLRNWSEYPPGMGDQEFDAWAVGFGFQLHALYGQNLGGLTKTSFTDAFQSYIAVNPIPPLRN